MMSTNRLSVVATTISRRFKPFGTSSSILTLAHRCLSTSTQENFTHKQQVVIDRYNSSTNSMTGSSTSAISDDAINRLPNDANDRNALYDDEDRREMGGITASVRTDWTKQEIADIYSSPFHELMYRASTVHRMYWDPSEVQQCTLLSIKTGGCTEDCSYCSQSTRHKTFVKPTPTMKVQEVLEAAQRAKEAGSTRFCMGAAWRELGNKKNAFNHILDMVVQICFP